MTIKSIDYAPWILERKTKNKERTKDPLGDTRFIGCYPTAEQAVLTSTILRRTKKRTQVDGSVKRQKKNKDHEYVLRRIEHPVWLVTIVQTQPDTPEHLKEIPMALFDSLDEAMTFVKENEFAVDLPSDLEPRFTTHELIREGDPLVRFAFTKIVDKDVMRP